MTAGNVRQAGAAVSDEIAAFGAYALSPARERLRRWGLSLGQGAIARRLCSLIRRIVVAGRTGPFDVEAFPGQNARLYPDENLSDKRVFAGAQFWDAVERAALGVAVRTADEPVYMVDAGANAGLYTLAVRAEAGPKDLKVLAIEPDPENLSRLRFNLAASGADADVTVAPVALSDRDGETRIAVNHANRGELTTGADGTPVAMRPLMSLVNEAGFPRVDALKIDIEGMEDPVLAHYLGNADRVFWPRLVILEAQRGEVTPALERLQSAGYRIQERSRMNAILALGPQTGTDRSHVEA